MERKKADLSFLSSLVSSSHRLLGPRLLDKLEDDPFNNWGDEWMDSGMDVDAELDLDDDDRDVDLLSEWDSERTGREIRLAK